VGDVQLEKMYDAVRKGDKKGSEYWKHLHKIRHNFKLELFSKSTIVVLFREDVWPRDVPGTRFPQSI